MSAARSAAASVELTALRELPLEMGNERTELAVDEVRRVRVEDEVLLTIPEIAQVRVIAGPESKGWPRSVVRREDNYRRLCEEAGVTDVSGARRAGHERQDAERNKEEALKTIERELRDLTPDVLLGKVGSLRGRVAAYPKERPSEPALPADLGSGLRKSRLRCQSWLRKVQLHCGLVRMMFRDGGCSEECSVGRR